MGERSLETEIGDLIHRQAAAGRAGGASSADPALDFEKWRLIHKYLHGRPFATRARLPRSEQWREAVDRIRDLGETELLDWALLQAEIARNLERGVQDLRPRKNGPCHGLLLEYVANRKRKALAILRFARAAEEHSVYGVNSGFHARTREILGQPTAEDEFASGGHEAVPWVKPKDYKD